LSSPRSLDGAEPECEPGHCVTCADEAIEMLVLATDGSGLASCVDPEGASVEVMTELVGEVAPGDAVLVHAGAAIARAA